MKAYQRHLIACADDDCTDDGGGKKLLKAAQSALGKDAKQVKCSKVSCLGLCKHGPVFLVYPDGVWYRCPNKAALKRIIEEHIQGGRVVEEFVLFQMPSSEANKAS
jgi:(2Fe-2S) ferredoxin